MSECDDLVVGIQGGAGGFYQTTWGELKCSVVLGGECYTLMDFTDGTTSTDLRTYSYDPNTGAKIPWDKLREEAKAIEGGGDANK